MVKNILKKGIFSGEFFENKWFYMKYIKKCVEWLLTLECTVSYVRLCYCYILECSADQFK